MDEDGNLVTLDRICVNDVCHCDWRLTLKDCVESKAMTIVNIINIGLAGITVVVGCVLLFHRVIIKGYRLYEVNISTGRFRTKPIDCMLLFIVIFNTLRLISSVILITDIRNDLVSRAFMFEFPWQFGFGAFALYLIGIAQALADSHRVIANNWLPSHRLVDFISLSIFLSPFIINNILALTAGIYSSKNLRVAIIMTRLLYIFWFLFCFALSVAVLFAGVRLTRILTAHLEKFNTSGPHYVSVQTGIFKIRTIMSIAVVCLLSCSTFVLCYAILRNTILVDFYGSIALGTIWNLIGDVSFFAVECAIIFNPKIDEPIKLGLSSSLTEEMSAEQAVQRESTTLLPVTPTVDKAA